MTGAVVLVASSNCQQRLGNSWGTVNIWKDNKDIQKLTSCLFEFVLCSSFITTLRRLLCFLCIRKASHSSLWHQFVYSVSVCGWNGLIWIDMNQMYSCYNKLHYHLITFALNMWNLSRRVLQPSELCIPSLQRCVRQTSNSCGRRCRGCRAVRRPWNMPRAWTWAPTALTLPQPSPKLPVLTSHCTAWSTDRATPQRETGTVKYRT